ncbi:muscarinic acetylcholine receptor M1-like [Strongylocentrotus purpuratus]|uniref:G-protein coupled receptors family 1 profile domain-containing protein n=1 Tax=Strongylocentrotus purpuratus TaxID=7668 RepID=A0A7M7T0H1_STRPU|nr:muscarinic acetylcholine receptor M1-like [Strongylocentrotus purpuratus]
MDIVNASAWPTDMTGILDGLNMTNTTPTDTNRPVFSLAFFLLVLLAVSTVMANSLILAAFYLEKKLRTYTNYFILNMTIADFVVGSICMPIWSIIHLYDGWPFRKVASIFFMGFQNSILGVSVCGVVVVCIDRYLATFYPIQHYQRRSIRKAIAVSIFTWVSSFGLWMMMSTAWDFIEPNNLVTSSGFSRPNYSLTYTSSLFMFALRFGLPFVIMTGLYVRIYFRVKNIGNKHLSKYMRKKKNLGKELSVADSICKGEESSTVTTTGLEEFEEDSAVKKDTVAISSISQNIGKSGSSGDVGSNEKGTTKNSVDHTDPKINFSHAVGSSNGENMAPSKNKVIKKPQRESGAEGQKAMRTLTFIVFVFIVTWLPTAVTVTMYAFFPDFYQFIKNKVGFSGITRWVAFSNSLVNPLAYAMAQPLFRQTIFKIIGRSKF